MPGCGGGGGGGTESPLALPPDPLSLSSPLVAGCDGGATTGTLYVDAEVEPFVAVAPNDPQRLVAAWQQDRWSDGGARALVAATSSDGGAHWNRSVLPLSRCGGGTSTNGADYRRVTDPWVDVGSDSTLHALGLAFNGASLAPGSSSAMLASRSTDGGATWSAPAVLLRDDASAFNDKGSITADRTDVRYVYAVWDRLTAAGIGPTWIARSSDGGASWEPARMIYTPSASSQTLGNRIVVLPDGTLVDLFTQIDTVAGSTHSHLDVIRSTDKGANWSAPLRIAELLAAGTRDPATGKGVRDGSDLGSIAVAPDGGLWVVWQDARFSAGQHDAIALSHSSNGGLTWSAPLAINHASGAAAFTPGVNVRSDGVLGVLHYDLRNASAGHLLADAWLLGSRDGVQWSETHVWGPFDLAGAPDSGGLFLGDYQGLVSFGQSFLPVLALSAADLADRSDIYALRIDGIAAQREAPQARWQDARAAPPLALTLAQRGRLGDALAARMERRLPGWRRVMGLEATAP